MTIVIPNHNEPNITELTKRLAILFPLAKVVVSNDANGEGKGLTLWRGKAHVDSLPVVFLDGDYNIRPEEIFKLLPYINKYDIVIGKKKLPRRIDRWFITLLSRFYIKILFGIGESQTGLKIFNYIPDWCCEGFMFDVEILYRAKQMGKTIKEVPIEVNITEGKSIKILWKAFLETLEIWGRLVKWSW